MIGYLRLILLFLLFTLFACEKKIYEHQKISNIEIENDILNCDNVFYSDKANKIVNHFYFGEKLTMSFKNLRGFKEEDGIIYPGLELLVLNRNKDTVLHNKDLFEDDIEGFENSSFELTPQITLGSPINSKSKYKVYTHLWDKVGGGHYKTKATISVVPDEKIKIKNSQFKYKELYLFSEKRNEVILDKKVYLDENIYLIVEGLEGFKFKDGKSAPAASMIITDSNGGKVFENPQLFNDTIKYSLSDIKERFSTYVIFNSKEKGDVKLRFRAKIWDKNDLNTSIQLSTNLLLVDKN